MKKLANIIILPLQIVSALVALALLMSILACYINPEKFGLLQFFGLLFQGFFVANLILLILWRIAKRRIAYLHFVMLLVSLFYFGRFVQFFGNGGNSKNTIKIISYNTHGFSDIADGKKVYDEIAQFLVEQDADIICLQEYYVPPAAAESAAMKAFLSKYKYGTTNADDDRIFSKLPLHQKSTGRVKNAPAVFFDFDVEGKTCRIYCCHLQSTSVNPESTQKNIADETKRNDEFLKLSRNLKNGFLKRAKQVDTIALHILQSPYPTIVCGDFNDTPMSYTYQKMRGNMNDAFVEAGCGMPHTFQKLFSILRIDYIFAHKQIKITDYNVATELKYSDHYPVISRFRLANK